LQTLLEIARDIRALDINDIITDYYEHALFMADDPPRKPATATQPQFP
jgi:hypothetical protein